MVSQKKKNKRDFSIGEHFIYSYIILGLFSFGIEFVLWRFDWVVVRFWIVMSFLLFMFIELNEECYKK